MLIQNLYRNFFKKKFFNKILVFYTTIIICAIFLLAYFVSERTSAQMLEKELLYNSLVLHNVNNYFDEKFNNVKKLFYQVYLDNSYNSSEIFQFLGNEIDKSDTQYVSLKKNFDSYFTSIFTRDSDILDIIVYKKLDRSVHLYSNNRGSILNENEFKYKERLSEINNAYSKLKILPTFTPHYYDTYSDTGISRVYTMINNIKSLVTDENLGTLMIDFNPEGITKSMSKYADGIKGNILILTEKGEVIYDYSGKYYEKLFPYNDLIVKSAKTGIVEGQKCIFNINRENNAGVIIAGIIPEQEIYSGIQSTKKTIYLIAFLCFMAAFVLTKTVTTIFSKRIGTITSGMKSVFNGNLTKRIPIKPLEDEIGDIAVTFNRMCDNLNEYIEKVYISDIKQKSAELTALQAQINPHFLYNTLEAIRMKAITDGSKEVGSMIYILAELFRSSVKDEAIVTISDEIKYSKSYLELFKIRYGNQLTIKYDIEENIMGYSIISHLVQPVIENYIVHGFDLRSTENKINITAFKSGEDIHIKISDNGVGIMHEELEAIKKALACSEITKKTSIGLRNANERIKLIYGSRYGLDIQSNVGFGTMVTIRIEAKMKEELTDYVQSIAGR